MATEEKEESMDEKDKQIEKLKTQNQVLRKMAAALQELANSEKQINDGLRKQNISLQKQLVEAFAAIALLQEKLNGDNEEDVDNEDGNENDEEACENCSLCYGEIEKDDLIVLDECKHKFHGQLCLLATIRSDIGLYERLPICPVCDGEGKSVAIPNEICMTLIDQCDDEELKEKYQSLSNN